MAALAERLDAEHDLTPPAWPENRVLKEGVVPSRAGHLRGHDIRQVEPVDLVVATSDRQVNGLADCGAKKLRVV